MPQVIAPWDETGHAACANGNEIRDLNGSRQSRVHVPAANLSLLSPKVDVPQLWGNSPAGVHWFGCYATLGKPDQSDNAMKQQV